MRFVLGGPFLYGRVVVVLCYGTGRLSERDRLRMCIWGGVGGEPGLAGVILWCSGAMAGRSVDNFQCSTCTSKFLLF